MGRSILDRLLVECPFQETLDDTELVDGCSFPVPKLKIGHLRADHDGWRWHNTVWPCHSSLATPAICKEIDHVYDKLTASNALKDLPSLRRFCNSHMEACIAKESHDEFSFFHVGKYCDFWIKLITRKGDYNLYLNAYAKGPGGTVPVCSRPGGISDYLQRSVRQRQQRIPGRAAAQRQNQNRKPDPD